MTLFYEFHSAVYELFNYFRAIKLLFLLFQSLNIALTVGLTLILVPCADILSNSTPVFTGTTNTFDEIALLLFVPVSLIHFLRIELIDIGYQNADCIFLDVRLDDAVHQLIVVH